MSYWSKSLSSVDVNYLDIGHKMKSRLLFPLTIEVQQRQFALSVPEYHIPCNRIL